MNHTTYSFIISTLAGLTTLIGALTIFIKSDKRNDIICYSLSFSAGIMITISIIDLIPTSLKYLKDTYNVIPSILITTLFIVIGIILSFFIKKIIPEKKDDNNKLFRTGLLSMIVLILHNIPEGIATFITSMNDITFGITLALAISFHNIPEGISIAIPIYYSTNSKIKPFIYTFIAGISELLGAFITYKFLYKYMNNLILSSLFAIIAGLMIHISMSELLPSAKEYGSINRIMKAIICAIILMIMCHYLLQ